MCVAESTVGERGAISFIEEQLSSREIFDDWLDDFGASEVKIDERIVLDAVQCLALVLSNWRKPMCVVDCAMGECKVLQRIGDGITGLLVDCGTGFTSVLPSTIMSATATDA